jgi:hypothetical protein
LFVIFPQYTRTYFFLIIHFKKIVSHFNKYTVYFHSSELVN